ncbi:hypothetical protein [Leifsonia sp. NPDC058248]|uniref:DUF7882 family protein n=1 Tax=Leifsonia sp. NPDC058248 TaxID=3346402 RepID=UPI0036DA12BE
MGTLIYGAGSRYEFDDRLLSHLKIAITTKLRMHEAFLVSWAQPVEQGSGRVSLWFSPAIPVQYLFDATKPPMLNRVWLDAMLLSATSPRGLIILPEEDAESFLRQAAVHAPEQAN